MTRPNRAQRRAQKYRPRGFEASVRAIDEAVVQVAILPGLPGSMYDYVSQAEKNSILEAEAGAHLDALAALHPGMMWRAHAVKRMVPLGIPEVPPVRLRHVTAAAPGALGRGVVLGEFTTEPEKRRGAGLIVPGRGGAGLRWFSKPSEARAAAVKFLKEFGE